MNPPMRINEIIGMLGLAFEEAGVNSPDLEIDIRQLGNALGFLKQWMDVECIDGPFIYTIIFLADDMDEYVKWRFAIKVKNLGIALIANTGLFDPYEYCAQYGREFTPDAFISYFTGELMKAYYTIANFNNFAGFAEPTLLDELPIDRMVEYLLDASMEGLFQKTESLDGVVVGPRTFYSTFDLVKRLKANSSGYCYLVFELYDFRGIGWFYFDVLFQLKMTPMKLLLLSEERSYDGKPIKIESFPNIFYECIYRAEKALENWNWFVKNDQHVPSGPFEAGLKQMDKVIDVIEGQAWPRSAPLMKQFERALKIESDKKRNDTLKEILWAQDLLDDLYGQLQKNKELEAEVESYEQKIHQATLIDDPGEQRIALIKIAQEIKTKLKEEFPNA